MADNSGGNGGLYFIVGALVVVVAIMGVVLTGHMPGFGNHGNTVVKIEAPAAPGK